MPPALRLAMHAPDIPQNLGAMMRLAACTGVGLDVVEPCGFPWDDRRIRRAAMDYIDRADLVRHAAWEDFLAQKRERRLLVMTTRAALNYANFEFRPDDILLAGSESAGAPEHVRAAADARLAIPMRPGVRSLNVVTAAAMVLGEALRQTGGFNY